MRWVLLLLLVSTISFGQSIFNRNLCNGDVEIVLEPDEFGVEGMYYPSVADGTLIENRFYYSVSSAGTYTIEYKLTNEYGCVAFGVATLLVDECPYWSFYVPNTFTPNGDEHNNTWYPKYENVYISSVQIFNRWGELVHDKKEPWDGHNAQDDVYAYRIVYIANNQSYESIGRVSIVR